jgi:hypothetical protein
MIIWREDVKGGPRRLGFVQSNQDPSQEPRATVRGRTVERTTVRRSKGKDDTVTVGNSHRMLKGNANKESVNNITRSVKENNVNKKSVTWGDHTYIEERNTVDPKCEEWITVTRRSGNRKRKL